MASFEPEQTPSRTGGSSRPDFRGRRVHSETQATRDCAAFTTSLPPRTTSNQQAQAVNHRIQHREDELQEMKLRQQRVEEQLRLLQEEIPLCETRSVPFIFFFNFVSLPHRIGRFPYIAINLYPPPPPPQLPGQVNKVQQHIREPQGSKKQRLLSELLVSASCR